MRQGYEVHIATALTDQLVVLKNHGLVVHPLTLNRSGVGLWAIGKTFWQIFRVCKFIKPDVVHFVTIKPVLLGGLAARLARVPAIVSAVSGLGFVFVAKGMTAAVRRWVVKQLYRVALGHFNLRVIFQNSNDLSSLSSLVELPDRKVTNDMWLWCRFIPILRNSIAKGCSSSLLAARLLVDKGVREFVQSAQILRKRGLSSKDVRFVVVGKPD